jgi:hypothetical protein
METLKIDILKDEMETITGEWDLYWGTDWSVEKNPREKNFIVTKWTPASTENHWQDFNLQCTMVWRKSLRESKWSMDEEAMLISEWEKIYWQMYDNRRLNPLQKLSGINLEFQPSGQWTAVLAKFTINVRVWQE